MRDLHDLPMDVENSPLVAVTCEEMDRWSYMYGQPLSYGWERVKRQRSSERRYLLGLPFIVIDLPPDPTTRKVFTPANPAEVWF